MSKPHACRALVIHCMDYRLTESIHDFLGSLDLRDQYDEVSLAGAAKGIADGDSEITDVILKQIKTAHDLHGIQDVFLMHHTDCGAYGGRAAFTSANEERERHLADMHRAADVLREQYPDLTYHFVLARIDEHDQVDFEYSNSQHE
ncbi:MAG: carbonic anhydrase [Patescibacteria group bacterium]